MSYSRFETLNKIEKSMLKCLKNDLLIATSIWLILLLNFFIETALLMYPEKDLNRVLRSAVLGNKDKKFTTNC